MRARIADRYDLEAPLGRGASATVYRSRDAISGETVAVKWWSNATEDVERWRREVATLRLLALPGMVRLLDHGVEDERPFVVMALVPGGPFPGTATPTTWAEIEPAALSLLDTLAAVHDTGVVHRDVKPSNVLVSGGRSVLLDFGLARPVEGGTLTTAGAIVGTPAYMAPELLMGDRADRRADLYAFGAMVYEALTGRFPHADASGGFVAGRVRGELAAQVRGPVADVVAALLHPDPRERPADARAVLARLAPAELPWIGPEPAWTPPASGQARVYGPPGAGRTAFVRRAVGKRPARWLDARRGLLWIAEAIGVGGDAPLATVEADAARALRALAGTVIVVDDADQLDPRSARLLAAAPGPVVYVGDDPHGADAGVPRLDDGALRALFDGPEALLHLPEDAAALLAARTSGWPARVARELRRWERAGHVTAVGGRWRVTRAGLDALAAEGPRGEAQAPVPLDEALDDALALVELAGAIPGDALVRALGAPRWRAEAAVEDLLHAGVVGEVGGALVPRASAQAPRRWTSERRAEAHGAVARALPAGVSGRWRHFALAGEAGEAGRDACRSAAALRDAGRLGEAASVLDRVLGVVRADAPVEVEADVVELACFVAFASNDPVRIDDAAHLLGRSARLHDPALAQLCAGASAALRGRGREALALLDGVWGAGERVTWRQTFRATAARALPPGDAEAVMRDVEAWAVGAGEHEARARVLAWRGLLAYERGDFEVALADLGAAAASPRARRTARLSLGLNFAQALLDAGRVDEAATQARALAEEARAARLALFESRATWVVRSADYRQGRATAPDEALVAAARALPEPHARAPLLLLEATIAWRVGRVADGGAWALEAAAAYRAMGLRGPAGLADALAAACGATVDAPVARVALDGAATGLRWQAAALWPALDLTLGAPPSGDPDACREVMSIREAERRRGR